MSIGEKLLELRKKYKYSQEDLATQLNVSRQTISNWENNITSPDLLQAKAISCIFNISLDELVDNNISKQAGDSYIKTIIKDKSFKDGNALVRYIEQYFMEHGGNCQ